MVSCSLFGEHQPDSIELAKAEDQIQIQRKELTDVRNELLNKEEILKEMRSSLMPIQQDSPHPNRVSGVESVIQEELEKTKKQMRRYETEIASRTSQSGLNSPSPAGPSSKRIDGETFDMLSEFHKDLP